MPLLAVAAAVAAGTVVVAPAVAGEIVGSKGGKVYHTDPDCAAAKKIQDENRITWKSAEEAEREGRRLCKYCQRQAAKPPPPERLDKQSEPGGRAKPPTPPPPEDKPPARQPLSPGERVVRVRKVLPGASFQGDGDEKFRLLGVCGLEKNQPLCEEATAFVERQLRGRKVVLTVEGSDGEVAGRDPWGQTLVYARCDGRSTDLGAELISHGLAWVDRDRLFDRREAYQRLEDQAYAAGLGIWKRLEGSEGRAEVVTGQHARHYHSEGCPHLVHLVRPSRITLNEARARRLVPCPNYLVKPPGAEHAQKSED